MRRSSMIRRCLLLRGKYLMKEAAECADPRVALAENLSIFVSANCDSVQSVEVMNVCQVQRD